MDGTRQHLIRDVIRDEHMNEKRHVRDDFNGIVRKCVRHVRDRILASETVLNCARDQIEEVNGGCANAEAFRKLCRGDHFCHEFHVD